MTETDYRVLSEIDQF